MATGKERIDAARTALNDAKKLYEDGQRQYEKALTTFNTAKAAISQAKGLVDTLKNPNLDAAQALQLARQFVPDPAAFAQQINQPGANPQEILRQQLNRATQNFNVVEITRRKAEREVQRINKFVEGSKARIEVLANQLQIALATPSLKVSADVQRIKNRVLIGSLNKKVKLNRILQNRRQAKAVIKAIAKAAAIYALSKLLNSELGKLSKDVQRLTELVDKTNEIISNVKTKQDVLKAKTARDAALVSLNSAERKITRIRNTIRTLQRLLTVLRLVLFLLLLIPLKTRPRKVQRITRANLNIDAATILLGSVRNTLESLIAEIQYQRSRLLPISDVVDQALNNDLTPEEIGNLLNRDNFGQLGPLEGVVYRGFTFAILEENDPNFVVAGNKRRFAVAYDRSGFVVLRSTPSFTLDPEVLVDELKLIIDEQNLEP